MRSVANIERKRILNRKVLIVISILIIGFSIVTAVSNLNNYNIYDQTGEVEISGWGNIKESKKKEHNSVLDENTLQDIVDRKDKSKYVYNSSNVRIANSVYMDKKLSELTKDDIKNFYDSRNGIINDMIGNSGQINGELTEVQINHFMKSSNSVKTPIEIGYAEGWKNLNNDMIDFVPLILGLISILILPIFGEDPKIKMTELYTSTDKGKNILVKSRILAGLQTGTLIYVLSMIVFSLSKLIVFGFQGGYLPIQSNAKFFFSIRNISYFQQYLLNFTIGFVAMLFIVAIVMLFTAITRQIVAGGVILAFLWIIMTMMPPVGLINRYFVNFLPYKMTDFNSYYLDNEIYNIFGGVLNKSTLVIIVSLVLMVIFIGIAFVISNRRLNKSL